MGDRDRLRGSDPVRDDGVELGGFRGVVLDETAAVKTVTEPPADPAQPALPGDASSTGV